MVQLISFRFIRTSLDRRICRLRFVILVILVVFLTIVVLVIHPPTARSVQQINKLLNKEPELRHFSQTVSGQLSGNSNDTSIPSMSAMVTLEIANTMAKGYLTQKTPMVGFGLGNQMFMYASMLGIADHSRMTPVYSKDLRQIFEISTGSSEVVFNFTIDEAQACAFDSSLFSLSDPHQNTAVIGYLQSWKYFNDIDEHIRQDFTFIDKLRAQANEFLENLKISIAGEFTDALFIGVHIRRNDMLADFNILDGYTVASKEYLVAAVNHFRTNFTASTLVFVVCTDDLDWSKKNFPMVDRNSFVAFSENRTAAQDMSLLASCNHTIITVGTFGWWSGYLAGGHTIYYKDFPKPGSNLDKSFKKEDYFPPNWIGL